MKEWTPSVPKRNSGKKIGDIDAIRQYRASAFQYGALIFAKTTCRCSALQTYSAQYSLDRNEEQKFQDRNGGVDINYPI